MDIDFASLAAQIAADVPGLRGCIIVSRDGLVLGAYPHEGESILRPAWLRFGSMGAVEKGFIQFPGELWVYASHGPYASFATADQTSRPGFVLDQMQQLLASAQESRAAAQQGVTIPESPVVQQPMAAPAQPPMQAPPVAQPPVAQPPVAQPPAAPPPAPAPVADPGYAQPPQTVPPVPPEPVQAPPQAAPPQPATPPAAQPPQPEPAATEPPPVPVAPGPPVGYHADYGGSEPAAPAAPETAPDQVPAPALQAADDIQIDRVALAQEFASLLAETGYDDEDDSA